jgi:hypothetical protein
MKRIATAVTGGICILLACGCNGKGIEIGPIPVTLPLGGGEIDPAALANSEFGPVAVGAFQQELCTLPTEDQLVETFRAGAGFAGTILQLSRVELEETTVRAVEGGFNALKAIDLAYIPANGGLLGRARLGSAASLTGFDDQVSVKPRSDVDLLEIIRANDNSVSAECPSIEIRAAGVVPDAPITWEAEIQAGIYARVQLF